MMKVNVRLVGSLVLLLPSRTGNAGTSAVVTHDPKFYRIPIQNISRISFWSQLVKSTGLRSMCAQYFDSPCPYSFKTYV